MLDISLQTAIEFVFIYRNYLISFCVVISVNIIRAIKKFINKTQSLALT